METLCNNYDYVEKVMSNKIWKSAHQNSGLWPQPALAVPCQIYLLRNQWYRERVADQCPDNTSLHPCLLMQNKVRVKSREWLTLNRNCYNPPFQIQYRQYTSSQSKNNNNNKKKSLVDPRRAKPRAYNIRHLPTWVYFRSGSSLSLRKP